MKTKIALGSLALAGVLLVGFSSHDGGQKFLRNCEVDVNPSPMGADFKLVAYYRVEDVGNEYHAKVFFSPPRDVIGMSDLLDDSLAERVRMNPFLENSATFIYDRTAGTMRLELSDGAGNAPDQVFYTVDFALDPLAPPGIAVTLAPATDYDVNHGRQRVWVDFRGLRAGFTLVDWVE